MTENELQPYIQFIDDLAHNKPVYYIHFEEDIAIVVDEDKNECIPFWTDEQKVKECVSKEWQNYTIQLIESEDFLYSWMNQFKEDKITILVNYNLQQIITATPDEILADVERKENE